MRLQKLIAVTVLLACASLSSGCAELDRKGGLADQLEDVAFRAETKSHRLLRSYVLIGVLLSVADQSSEADKKSIKGQLEGALGIVKEGYDCLFPQALDEETTKPVVQSYSRTAPTLSPRYRAPHWCQFFDEKMRRLDHSLYHLATVSLYSDDGRARMNAVSERMIGRVPVVSETLKSLVAANRAVKEATTFVDDLLTLSVTSFGPAVKLLPLYRDVVELNSWIVLDSLAIQCANEEKHEDKAQSSENGPAGAVSADLRYPKVPELCGTYTQMYDHLARGHGSPATLQSWIDQQDFLRLRIDAYPTHFYVVTRFVANACIRALGEKDCLSVFQSASGNDDKELLNKLKFVDRQVTAFLETPTRYVDGRKKTSVARTRPALPDPVSTGSIPRVR